MFRHVQPIVSSTLGSRERDCGDEPLLDSIEASPVPQCLCRGGLASSIGLSSATERITRTRQRAPILSAGCVGSTGNPAGLMSRRESSVTSTGGWSHFEGCRGNAWVPCARGASVPNGCQFNSIGCRLAAPRKGCRFPGKRCRFESSRQGREGLGHRLR